MYSCSTLQWHFSKECLVVAQDTCISPILIEYMQPEHKASERSQPKITALYLNLISHYVDTTFVHSNLGTGQGPSSEPGH